jgi:hypothetical protein
MLARASSGVLLFIAGIAVGAAAVAVAQEGRPAAPPPPPTLASLQADVERLKQVTPSLSHGMQDVALNWTNMWFAGQKKNWPLARYFFNESRSHIQWTVRISPTPKGPDGNPVDLKGIFDGIDTSSLAMVKKAIEDKSAAQFVSSYKVMLESCYACHKAVGKDMIRPMVPTAPAMTIVNYDPAATWPQ